ncbi:hypothetical protein [Morganella morganii]|uniref:hypothetical protein n=1 Tax=Morganella morganii TaxID=582 RepID=UPI001FFD9C8A|nr:hypothetical protein [Morganella morganii]
MSLTTTDYHDKRAIRAIRDIEQQRQNQRGFMSNPIMKYFEYQHLPAHLQEVSKPVGDLAKQMDEQLPDGAEKSAGLRKLLEAKDCLVRAKLG